MHRGFFHRFLDYDGYGLGCHVGCIIILKAAIVVS